jgi:nucleotide-binding universal stress UspA family protein
MNTVRSMLVHVDGTARCAARLFLAHELARELGAELTALFGTNPRLFDPAFSYAAGAVSPTLLQDLQTQWLASAKAAFEEFRLGRQGKIGWAELDGIPAVDGVAEQAFYADLLVLGQHDPSDVMEEQLPAHFVASVLIRSGRPAVVLPHEGNFRTVGHNVLVAWKPSAPCTRALAAALPLLQRSEQVHVAVWGLPHDKPHCHGDVLDVEQYLLRHGVKPIMRRRRYEPANVGDALLLLAGEIGADLMVMGCYGHSRAREFLLGGTSRTVLQWMTLPVLMSH